MKDTRVIAEIVISADGRMSREMVRIIRVLDSETLLVKIESSLSTPAMLRGLVLPIMASAVVS